MTRHHPFSRPIACLVAALGSFVVPCCTSVALAQNLFRQPTQQQRPQQAIPALPQPQPPQADQPASGNSPQQPSQPTGENAAAAAVAPIDSQRYADPLAAVSLFAVTVPPPHKYAKHDPVEVIINESSIQNLTQTTDNKKDYDLSAELSKFPSLEALFKDFSLREGINGTHPGIGVTGHKQIKGDGKMTRKDQVTAKMTATVIDVKPNGTLVLEARKSITVDKEITTMVLSGVCRNEDITRSNTVLSDQLADFNIRILHEGDVKETGTKGIIPRVLEAIFNF